MTATVQLRCSALWTVAIVDALLVVDDGHSMMGRDEFDGTDLLSIDSFDHLVVYLRIFT